MTMPEAQGPVEATPVAAAPHGSPLEFSGVAGVAQSNSLKGSQMLAATIAAPPLLGLWFGLLDKAARTRVLNEVADAGAQQYETMSNAAYDALGFTRAGPAERLAFYEGVALKEGDPVKTPEAWQEQQAKYPNDYNEDWNDFQRLIRLASEGRLVEG